METFDILPSTEVVLYGAGNKGREHYGRLKNYCRIAAFMDIAAKRMEQIFPVPVIHPFGSEAASIDRNTAVIICLNLPSLQREIAETLFHMGFRKLLFFPEYSLPYSTAEATTMRRAFKSLCGAEFEKLRNIPCYPKLKSCAAQPFIIEENKEYITTLMSVDILYNLSDGGGTVE